MNKDIIDQAWQSSHRHEHIQSVDDRAREFIESVYGDREYALEVAVAMAAMAIRNNTGEHLRKVLSMAAAIADCCEIFGKK